MSAPRVWRGASGFAMPFLPRPQAVCTLTLPTHNAPSRSTGRRAVLDPDDVSTPSLVPLARRAAVGLLLLVVVAVPTMHAQSPPAISIELSPGHSVPMNTAITGAITLTNLDTASYSSLVFRADMTGYGAAETRCNGDDTGRDIEIPVDASVETSSRSRSTTPVRTTRMATTRSTPRCSGSTRTRPAARLSWRRRPRGS